MRYIVTLETSGYKRGEILFTCLADTKDEAFVKLEQFYRGIDVNEWYIREVTERSQITGLESEHLILRKLANKNIERKQ